MGARPAESEAKLSYAALADVVGPAFDEARAQLPGPQELALAATLLRVTSSEPADPRTVATAVVGVLTELVREQPVLVAIDDVQWVDLASRRALEFAVRRLPVQLRLLVTRRSDGAAEVPLELDRALPPDAFQRVVLGSLSLASLHHIVRERLGFSPTRPMIARITEASGGNPFFAIEIAGAGAGRAAGPGEHGPLPVPRSVQKLAAERVKALSGAAREAVLVAASLSRPTADAVMAALPDDVAGGAALAEAEDAGVLGQQGTQPDGPVRYCHSHHLFTGHGHGQLAEEGSLPVVAIRQHQDLAVVADLEQLLRTAVHVADDRLAADDPLAVQGQPQPEYAVRRRVLRTDVEHHVGGRQFRAAAGPAALVRGVESGRPGADSHHSFDAHAP
jgi:hypothetical protein